MLRPRPQGVAPSPDRAYPDSVDPVLSRSGDVARRELGIRGSSLLNRGGIAVSAPLRTHNFTVDEYHRMAEAGVFREDDRIELIDGQVVEMTPIGVAHAGCVNRLTELFSRLAGTTATLSVQNPLILAEHQEPQPDFTVLRRRADGYGARHPRAGDVLLVIEVADTSVESDRRIKIPLYAEAGISEAWLVNLPADRIEVYCKPTGDKYAEVTSASRGHTLTPLEIPSAALIVDRILG